MDVMTLAGKLARVIDEKGLGVHAEDLTSFGGVGGRKSDLDPGSDRVCPATYQARGGKN